MAWVHHHINARSTNWKSSILQILRRKKPAAQTIRAALSHGRDFHLWIHEGVTDSDREWQVLEIRASGSSWQEALAQELESSAVVLLGFNAESPPLLFYLRGSRTRERPEDGDGL